MGSYQARANAHDEHDPAISEGNLLHAEQRNPRIDATPGLVIKSPQAFVESGGIDADKPGGCPIAVLLYPDNDVAAIGVGERGHVGQEIARTLVIGAWKRFLEVKRDAFAASIRDEPLNIFQQDLVESFVDHALV